MKVSERKRVKKFEPFTLDIVIESEEELLNLVKRLNISDFIINDVDTNYPYARGDRGVVLWEVLDNKWNQLKGEN